ncbi:hypothetical protein DQ04_00851150 [Trypanosoma grayi]|uniref:hypothetical protein n=1 Tax=Trypanosoma grayi TaxID=71804 RepID=UPI0004F45BED|nr:hypothetical protein DQ04_00851150 [Trypanosoma grayi]KEG13689.1 hypothetical protein DQ04_00851150 [Trypanosoma grayi]
MLHAFEEHGSVPITCVADLYGSAGSFGQLQNLEALSASAEGAVTRFNVWNGRPTSMASCTGKAPVTAMLMVPKHSLVWCGDEKGSVTVFQLPSCGGLNTADRSPLASSTHCRMCHESAVVSFATDGDAFVYSGSSDGSLLSWSVQEPFQFQGHVGHHTGELAHILAVCGGFLVSVGPDSSAVHVWPVGEKRAMQEPFALRGHTDGVLSCLHVGGVCLWSGGEDRFIRVWDLGDPVHLSCRLVTPSLTAVRADAVPSCLSNEETEPDEEEEGDDSLQDNSIRMLAGHKESVVALRESRGIVFSCDVSGVILAWNANRFWLLHAFRAPLGTPLPKPPSGVATVSAFGSNDGEKSAASGVGEVIRGARCLSFVEGFFWIIDTPSGPRSLYMPSHPRLRKALSDGSTDAVLSSDELKGEDRLMAKFGVYMRYTMDLFTQYTELRNEAFFHHIFNVAPQQQQQQQHEEEAYQSRVWCGVGSLKTTSPHSNPSGEEKENESVVAYRPLCEKCSEVDRIQVMRVALEKERALFATKRMEEEKRLCMERQKLAEERARLEGRAQALSRLQTKLIESKRHQVCAGAEYEKFLQSIRKRELEREHQLASVSTELSYLRLKYGDWSGAHEEGF